MPKANIDNNIKLEIHLACLNSKGKANRFVPIWTLTELKIICGLIDKYVNFHDYYYR